jgi:TM2 domain-containing membrane protein YozV
VNRLLVIFLLLATHWLSAQTGGEMTIVQDTTKTVRNDDINPLSPAKAAFYSAIFPGLGQAYNKKYWKMPLVYAAIGTSTYFYIWNNNNYNEYRNAYKRRLAGYTDDKFYFLSDDRLLTGQKFYQKNRDLSALITVAFYVLNIVDANVDAHLKQFNVNDNLTFEPQVFPGDAYNRTNIGFTLNYRF